MDAEHVGGKNGQVAVWLDYCMEVFNEGYHRKKQKTVTLEGKVMTVKEAIKFLTNL